MLDRESTIRDGLGDLLLVMALIATVSIVAALPRPINDQRRELALVSSSQSNAVGTPSQSLRPWPGRSRYETGLETSSFASRQSRVRSRPATPHDPSSRSPDDDDSRAYLAHMTAVMHRGGLPLPGDAGRLQSLTDSSTPVATTVLPRAPATLTAT
jgi:hypothetical protein